MYTLLHVKEAKVRRVAVKTKQNTMKLVDLLL